MSAQPPPIVSLPSSATVDEIKALTDRDGAVIVQNVLSPDVVRRINAELDPLLVGEEVRAGYSEEEERAAFYGRNTKRLQSIAAHSDAAIEGMIDTRMLGWVDSYLRWGTEFWLNSAMLIDIGPGEQAQILHRDEDLWPQLVAATPGEFTVSCMWALSDYSEEVGATRVVPRTRRAVPGEPDSHTAADSVPALMAAGDALFYTGTVVHGGGANVTVDRWRRGMVLSFILGWVRTEEAHTLAVSTQRAAQLPPRLRELLGFAAYRAEMGELSQLDMADPYAQLFNEPRPV